MGLTIKQEKNKIITNTHNPDEITIGGKNIVMVKEYRYLGQILAYKNKMEKELKTRRANS